MLDLEGIKIVEGKIFICREFFSIWLYWCQRNENDRTCVHMYILRSSEVWRGKCKCHKDAVGGRPIRWNQRKCVEPQGREGDPKMQRTCAVPLEDFIFHFSPGTIPEELWSPRPSESEYSTQSVAWSFESARQWKREPFSVSGSSRINCRFRFSGKEEESNQVRSSNCEDRCVLKDSKRHPWRHCVRPIGCRSLVHWFGIPQTLMWLHNDTVDTDEHQSESYCYHLYLY